MAAPRTVRISLLIAAIGLAGCSSLPRSVTIEQGKSSSFALVSKNGPVLTLRNDSGGHKGDVYSGGQDTLAKVVPDAEMQALLDIFTAEDLFKLSLPSLPGGARDVLRFESGGKRWFWARRGSYTDPREAAFNKARAYFLSLYNGSTAYHSGPSSNDGRYPEFLTPQEQARRAAELRRLERNKALEKMRRGNK